MITPAPIDPPEITNQLWHGFSGNTGFDVGANCGQTIPRMLTRFHTVIAYEPSQECREYLDKFPEIVLRPVAVTDHEGDVDLVVYPDKINTGQLVTDGVSVEWNVDTDERSIRRVPATTLDVEAAQYGAPDFIKVDVEGHEQHVLDGAMGLITTRRPLWLIEFHSRDLHTSCVGTLEGNGYRTETVRHPHYPYESDLWYTHGWVRAFPM